MRGQPCRLDDPAANLGQLITAFANQRESEG
jgi:hypothetical protein